ncbi:b(0,+)-type amino acid transporter 1-like [Ruditapes philippinarum]|uniref:b(0,+)-type amino acid transporter 1-like n=1 Tax=Ruditapes philippinarum TaxID=129788 RepID=UPI00295AEA2B|nr:b(0,+)-type amino acid transporter 1-like [Ruditapes philippinarum]
MDENNVVDRKTVKSTDGNTIVLETDRIRVKERIGLWGGIAFIMGAVIGSGIFISPRGALKNSGSVGMSLVIWALCGFLSMVIGLVYAELGVLLPKSGGDYTIIKTGIGGIPAFLVSWTQCTVTHSGSRAVLALVFADYVCAPIFGKCEAPDSIRKSIAAVELLLLAITNTISVRLVSSMQGLFTCLKILALIVITVGGFVYLFQGKTENFNDSFHGTTDDVTLITLAIYSCMWAYGGYINLNEFAEEIIQPKKNIPKAIIISMTLVTIIYITTNVSYFVMLEKSEFLTVPAVAFTWGERVLGSAAILIPISVMCSVHGASNGGFFSDVRVRFAAARAGHLPEVLSFLHHKSRIPLASLFLNTVVSLILLIPGDIGELINLVSFVGFLTNGLAIISFLRIRYLRRNDVRNKNDFRIPLFIAVLALAICAFMVIAPFISNPKIEFMYGVGFVLSGLILYIPFVYFEWRLPGCDKMTCLMQLLMDICPTVLDKDLDPWMEESK